ncbi:ammonium transmembrane transporter [Rhodotorula toruloides]|uniref:Ammonium transporter n=1 Tax=Rhodotorula toruloides TaxID=5286 RepID=A0A511KNF7_RHOTO|nr:ammonium transmembrane transporter [Rhodotorula toruloides]
MVNITYGDLIASSQLADPAAGKPYSIQPGGTDMIVTLAGGQVASYNPGDIAWLLACTALVWLMIPGVGYLYSGLVRRKNALTVLFLTMLAMAIISFQWFFWGYSLAFSPTGGKFLGDMHFFVLRHVLETPVPQANNKVPQVAYMIYQNMFAALVPAVLIGAAAERGRILPACIFFFCWSTVVYCPIAHWVWAPEGWAFQYGVLDYAGGGPIEICSGVTGLVYSIFLGKRRGFGTHILSFKPHNVSFVIQGTILLWVGWIGFNGGSTFAANIKAAVAIVNTNLAASFGGLAWMLLDYRLERKWSAVGYCTGAICGLVAITPAAGYVGYGPSIFIGVVAAGMSNLLTTLKGFFAFDDAMDIYACHGVAGICGLVFTGVFAQADIAATDGYTVIPGGWLDGNYIQVGKQLAYICAVWGWTFVVSYALMFLINLIPGCKFRVDEEGEIIGVDEVETGEFCYDFIALRREVDSTHGFYPLSTPNQHVSAGAGPAAHVRPASVSSSEERLRHRHEVAANGGHEVRSSGPLMPVVGRKTGLEGFLPESENLAGDEEDKEREEMVDEEDDGDGGGVAGEKEGEQGGEEKKMTSQVASLSLAPQSTSPPSSESDTSPIPPTDLASLVANVDPAIKDLPLPSPPPPGAYIFPDSQGRASFSSEMESPPPAHSSEVLKGVEAGGKEPKTSSKRVEGLNKSEAGGEPAELKPHPFLLLPSAFFASSTCSVCRRPLQAFTAEKVSDTVSGEQAKEAVLRHWGCLRIQIEEGKIGVGVGS